MTKSNLDTALQTLLKKLRSSFHDPAPRPQADDPIEEFIWSFLLWESTETKAENALKRIRAGVFDYNELRVSLPNEIVALLGERYPNAPERAVRMRGALDDIFRKENAVSLSRLKILTKREARHVLESIDATPSFVSSRVLLLALGGHAVPLDQRLLDLLIDEGVFEEGATLDESAAQLVRHVRAANAVQTHLLLQAWSESGARAKTTKKTTTKKPAASHTATRTKTKAAKTTVKKKSTRTKAKK